MLTHRRCRRTRSGGGSIPSITSHPALRQGTLFVLAAAVLLRFAWLDADPGYAHWAGYITDEGRWTEYARSFALFGSMPPEGWTRIHLMLAPAYQAVTAVFFLMFGVGFISARIVSALAGTALLIAAFFFLRRFASPHALLLGMVVLAFQPDFLFLSRVAVPEMAAMLFQFLAFAILFGGTRTGARAAAGGALTAVALAFKATVAPIVPIFAVALWLTRSPGDSISWPRQILFYGVGFVLAVTLMVLLTAVATGGLPVMALLPLLDSLQTFIRPASIFSAASFPMYGDGMHVLGIFLAPVWIIAGLLVAAGRVPPGAAKVVYVASGFWLVAWMSVSALLAYFPGRYVVHGLIPATLHLCAGLTLLQHAGIAAVVRGLERRSGLAPLLLTVWLALPTAGVLASFSIAGLAAVGFRISQFREHLAAIVLFVMALTLITSALTRLTIASRHPRRLLLGMCVLPIVVGFAWLLTTRAGIVEGRFWSGDGWGGTALLAMLVAVTLIMSVGYAVLRSARVATAAGTGLILAVAVTWLSWNFRSLIAPTRTTLEASRALGSRLKGAGTVGSRSASTLFLANPIRYVEFDRDKPLPDVLVVAFRTPSAELLARYRLIETYPIRVGATHLGRFPPTADIRIYERVR